MRKVRGQAKGSQKLFASGAETTKLKGAGEKGGVFLVCFVVVVFLHISLGAISSIKPAFSLSSLHSSRDAGDCGKNASSECSPDEE